MNMRSIRSLPAVAIIMATAGMTGVSHAQQTTAAPGAAQPAATPTNATEAKPVLERARAAYRSAKTYQDKVKLTFDMKAKTRDGQDQDQSESEELTFVFAGPRKFAAVHTDFGIYSSGETQTIHLKIFSQYVEEPAADEISETAHVGPMGIVAALHLPANLLISPTKFTEKFPGFSEVTGVKAEEVGGKPGKRVFGKGALPEIPEDSPLPISAWFSDETGMVGEVTVDLKPFYEEIVGDQMKIEKATATMSFKDVEVNSEIAPEKYTFKAGEDDKKVESFAPSHGPDPQQELVGKACPDFKGVDLEGKPLSLSDFKGKVVLLDFWATWCAPCVQAIPKIQEIAGEYADKGVVVIGMNQDEADAVDQVKQMVEKKKLTFRQFMDPEGETAQRFLVTGIPCTVLVDGKGIIQWIHTGAGPGVKKEITSKLDKVLKGESLVEKAEEPKK